MRKVLLMPEVSDRIQVPVDTLRFWRSVGKGPKSFRLGRRVAYLETEVDRWLDEQAGAA